MSVRRHPARRRGGARVALGVAVMLCAVATARADGIDAAAITRQGNGRGAPPCMACHGATGGGNATGGFPRLAGLPATYLTRQLDAFASGARQNGSMQVAATALSPDERAALAAYYASLQAPTTSFGAGTSASAASSASVIAPTQDSGAWLATRGRWSKGLLACAQCHGPNGIGVGDSFPPLVGQPASYLAAQLRAWQHGTRHGDPLGLMQAVASKLDAADVTAVTDWYAAQPRPSSMEAKP